MNRLMLSPSQLIPQILSIRCIPSAEAPAFPSHRPAPWAQACNAASYPRIPGFGAWRGSNGKSPPQTKEMRSYKSPTPQHGRCVPSTIVVFHQPLWEELTTFETSKKEDLNFTHFTWCKNTFPRAFLNIAGLWSSSMRKVSFWYRHDLEYSNLKPTPHWSPLIIVNRTWQNYTKFACTAIAQNPSATSH